MPVSPPPGFITRAQAPKHYSRSKRALERDLDDAYKRNDADVLSHYLLVTKDGDSRFATEITTDKVKQLMADGQVPTWCIEESYLQRLAQSDSKVDTSHLATGADATTTTPEAPESTSESSRSSSQARSTDDARDDVPLPDDVGYLKARLRILEREKQEQQRQHQETVAKLWNEIDVKNEQIQSWNEVTQGITKGLATGALTPVHSPDSPYLLARNPRQSTDDTATSKTTSRSAKEHLVQSPPEMTQPTAHDTRVSGAESSQASAPTGKQQSKARRGSRASSTKPARAKTKRKSKSQSEPTKQKPSKTSKPKSPDGLFARFRKAIW